MLDTEIDDHLMKVAEAVARQAQSLREVTLYPTAIVAACDRIAAEYTGPEAIGNILVPSYAADGSPIKVERLRAWNQVVADFGTVRGKAAAAATWNATNGQM